MRFSEFNLTIKLEFCIISIIKHINYINYINKKYDSIWIFIIP